MGTSLHTRLSKSEISGLVSEFAAAAQRAAEAGFEIIEIHMAHGYLLHEFLSPLSNRRNDEFGGDLESRMKFPLQVAQAVPQCVAGGLPSFCAHFVYGLGRRRLGFASVDRVLEAFERDRR